MIVDHGVPPILAASNDAQAERLLELADQYELATTASVKATIDNDLTAVLRTSPFWRGAAA